MGNNQGVYLPSSLEVEFLARWEPDVGRASARMAKRCRGAGAESDDFAQEARLRLLMVYRQRGSVPQGYGRRVVKHAISNAARPVIRTHKREDEEVDADELGNEEFDASARSRSDANVASLVARLPARVLELYGLLYVKEFSQREAAATLGVSQPRIAQLHKELLFHARVLLMAT